MAAKKHKRTSAQKGNKRLASPPVLTQSARPARPLFRLLPATICTASLLLTLKVVEIVQEGKELTQALFIETAIANTAGDKEENGDKKEEKPAAAAATDAEKTDVEKDAGNVEAEKPVEEGKEGEKKPEPLPPGASKEPPPPTPEGQGVDVPAQQQSYNKREVDILESLSARREKIEEMERDLALRSKVLEATEQRIDTKITELTRLNKEVKDMLVVHSKEEDAKMASLVKIYEAMKPKDAARIFDEMDMDVLLMVISRMSERRVAPILAAMSPQKAKDVTEQLAEQQKARANTLDAAEQVQEGPPL